MFIIPFHVYSSFSLTGTPSSLQNCPFLYFILTLVLWGGLDWECITGPWSPSELPQQNEDSDLYLPDFDLKLLITAPHGPLWGGCNCSGPGWVMLSCTSASHPVVSYRSDPKESFLKAKIVQERILPLPLPFIDRNQGMKAGDTVVIA